MMLFKRGWWQRALQPKPAAIDVLVYTRRGCHLCDQVLHSLRVLGREFPLQTETRDIDTDPDLAQRFDQCVPVVFINGKKRCWGRIEPSLLRRMFRGLNRSV